MSLTHALLGLLAVEPASGYELTKAFEGDLGRYAWQAGHTSIYPELVKMAERGLVEVTREGARGSRTYAVTPAGRDELRDWLMNWPAHGRVRSEPVLRMFLLSALEPADALTLLHQIAERAEHDLAQLRLILDEHGDRPLIGREGFGLLAAEFGIRQYAAVQDWAQWAIGRLEAATSRP
jgi:DNA-binding PadR family transcriptional regulator